MKLGRRKKTSTGRQRPVSQLDRQPVSQNMSYSSSRSDAMLNTGRVKQREFIAKASRRARRFWFQRFGLLILVCVALLFAVNLVTLSSNANIVQVDAKSTKLPRPASEYQAAATELLEQSFWNRNKLTVDTDKIAHELKRQFPELDGVSVALPFFAHRPLVYVQPAKPSVILTNTQGVYLLNMSGKAIAKADSIEELREPTLPVITDHSELQFKLGQYALPADDIAFIQEVIAQLEAKQIKIASMTLPVAASELDLQVAGEGYIVKFNLHTGAAREQAGIYLATLGNLKQQNITPAQYIDVRVEGRAYYQ